VGLWRHSLCIFPAFGVDSDLFGETQPVKRFLLARLGVQDFLNMGLNTTFQVVSILNVRSRF